MKIEVLKEELIDILEAVGTTVAQKSVLSVLQMVLLEAEDSKLTIYSMDGTASAKGTVYVEQEEAGATCINYALLNDIIKSLPNDSITIETNERSCFISCDRAKFELATYDTQDFPKPFEQSAQISLQVKQQEFKEAVGKVLPFVALMEASMPVLTGVNFEIDNGKMMLVGCDKIRMATASVDVETTHSNASFVLPAKHIKEIARLCNANEDELQINVPSSGNTIIFKLPNVTITIQKIAGSYINWRKVIAVEFGATVQVNKNDLYGALERTSLVFDNIKEKITILNIKKNQILLTAQSSIGRVKESIAAETDAEFQIAFNTRYLLDIFKQIENENVTLKFVKPNSVSPIYVQDNNFIVFALPIKIKEEQKTTAA